MGAPQSPSHYQLREQRAQQAAVMQGYGKALTAAYLAEPLPAYMQRLLDQLERRERCTP